VLQICRQVYSSKLADLIKGKKLRVEIMRKQTDKLKLGEPAASGKSAPAGA
jgi:hypothetical protein